MACLETMVEPARLYYITPFRVPSISCNTKNQEKSLSFAHMINSSYGQSNSIILVEIQISSVSLSKSYQISRYTDHSSAGWQGLKRYRYLNVDRLTVNAEFCSAKNLIKMQTAILTRAIQWRVTIGTNAFVRYKRVVFWSGCYYASSN